jgi:hypothetical protein
VRPLALLLAAALAFAAAAQDKAPPPKKKKPAAHAQVVHRKPTAEQIRKFDKLEKKQEAPQKK